MQTHTLTNDMKTASGFCTGAHMLFFLARGGGGADNNVASVTNLCIHDLKCVCIYMRVLGYTPAYAGLLAVCVCVSLAFPGKRACVFSSPVQLPNSVSSGLSDINGWLFLPVNHPPAGKIGP